jgi:hypothetical protein
LNTTAPVTKDFGPTPERTILSITTWTDHDGISLNVFTAGRRNSALSATFLHADRAAAIAWYTTIRDAAKAGQPVWLIEAGVSALIDAAQTVGGADADLADRINATMDDAQPKPVDVSDILDDAAKTGGWAGYRQSATTRPAVTSEPMDRIITAAVDGYVPRSRQATSVQLIALARRGLVELHYGRRGNQRVIVGARLTNKGSKKAVAA